MKSLIIILEFLIISSSISQWQQINSGISGTIVRGITSNGQYLFAASDGYGVYRGSYLRDRFRQIQFPVHQITEITGQI